MHSLKNIGPKTIALLNQIGIHTKADFLAQDPDAIYGQIIGQGYQPHRALLAAIWGAKLNTDWKYVLEEFKSGRLVSRFY